MSILIGNRKICAVLLLIILLGSFLRFYKIGETAFDRDEFFELNSSYGYHQTGQWLAWDFGNEKPFNADFQDDSSNERAEIFRMQLAFLYNFAEPSEGLTRSLGAIWGVLGIFLVYLVAFSMTGSRIIGLIAAFLIAVGYAEVLYSRRLRMYAMLFPIYLAFSWIVYKFYESKYKGRTRIFSIIYEKTGFNVLFLMPLIAVGFVSYNTHVLSAHIIPVVAVYALVMLVWIFIRDKYFLKNFKNGKFYLNKYFLTSLGFFIGLLIYQLPVLDGVHKTIRKNFRFFRSDSNEDFFFQYFSDFNFVFIGVFLALFGTWFLAKRMKKKREATFLFLSMAVPLFFAIFTWRRDISQRYIYFFQSFGIILSAVGIFGMIELVKERVRNIAYRKFFIVTLSLLLFFSLDFDYIFSKNTTKNVYVQGIAYPDFKPAFDHVMKNKKDGDVMITRAYRSFYWRGNDIKVFDTKSLITGSRGCEIEIDKIIQENSSGWVVYPLIDSITVCAEGRKYYKENLIPVIDSTIPSSVKVYRW